MASHVGTATAAPSAGSPRSTSPPPASGAGLGIAALPQSPPSPTCRPRSLMESLLVAKMERAALSGGGGGGVVPPSPPSPAPLPALLLRTDSTDSASSFSSASSDVCRCDDCLLGTADVLANRKKVGGFPRLTE